MQSALTSGMYQVELGADAALIKVPFLSTGPLRNHLAYQTDYQTPSIESLSRVL